MSDRYDPELELIKAMTLWKELGKTFMDLDEETILILEQDGLDPIAFVEGILPLEQVAVLKV